jgi:hypothetical protein
MVLKGYGRKCSWLVLRNSTYNKLNYEDYSLLGCNFTVQEQPNILGARGSIVG